MNNSVLLIISNPEKKILLNNILNNNKNIGMVFESKNGIIALQIILQYKPSIVITDHFVPLGTAESFIDEAIQNNISTKFITLFDYKKEMPLNYHDYIIDAINPDSITDSQINHIISKAINHPETSKPYAKISTIEKETILTNILLGILPSNYNEILNESQFNIKEDVWLVYILHQPKSSFSFYSERNLLLNFFDKINNFLKKYYGGEIFIASEDKLAIIINSGPSLYTEVQLAVLLRELNKLKKQFLNYENLIMLSSSTVANIKNIYINREQLDYLSSISFFLNNEDITFDNSIKVNTNISYKILIQSIENLKENMLKGDIHAVHESIEYIFDELIKKSYSNLYYETANQLLISCANSILFEFDSNSTAPFISEVHPFIIDAKKRVLEQYDVLLNKIKSTPTNPLVRKAYKYICNNYHQNIDLKTVAKHISINHIYLCRLFSQYFNKGFPDILNEIRIKEACDLIKNGNRKVSTIAYLVGYSTPKYFSKIFKRHTGMSPKKYIQNLDIEVK